MGYSIKRSGSFLPVLMKVCQMTYGSILELGAGYNSTAFLHWCAFATNRKVVTYESDPKWFEFAKQFEAPFHEVHLVENWDAIDLSPHWSVALVDHSPPERRRAEVQKLLHADYVVLHDSDPERVNIHRYHRVRHLFKYHYNYTDAKPNTSVWSNTYDFANFKVYDPIDTSQKKLALTRKELMFNKQHGIRRKYTICRCAREMYIETSDPVIRAKLRYIASLAEAITSKLKTYAPDWLGTMYPKRNQFAEIMKDELQGQDPRF